MDRWTNEWTDEWTIEPMNGQNRIDEWKPLDVGGYPARQIGDAGGGFGDGAGLHRGGAVVQVGLV